MRPLLVPALVLALVPLAAAAQTRSWTELPSANGYTGVVVDLAQAKVHHFRDHLFATEEPRREADGAETWAPTEPGGSCFQPQPVFTRDLLYDAYFGLAAGGTSTWLQSRPVDLDASGYDGIPSRPGRDGGTGIVRMVQPLPALGLTATTRVWAPWALARPAFVLTLEVVNDAAETSPAGAVYALVNAHLGSGRPGPDQEIGADFETVTRRSDVEVLEQGFAGALVVRALGAPVQVTHSPVPIYDLVRDGGGDLPAPESSPVLQDDAVEGLQWTLPALAPGTRAWVGAVVAYDADPDAVEALEASVEAFVGGKDAEALWEAERAGWAAFQDRVTLPAGLSPEDEDLARHSAAILRMAQVRETETFLRAEVDPGRPRRTGGDGAVQAVEAPGQVRPHAGAGAVLASLPPGRWTYAWVRDGAYAIAGLVDAGLFPEARAALAFFLDAEADRYRTWDELSGVPLSPYALSLTRYHGFGIEESDTLCGGDLNVEFDGFGLFLWALARYVRASGDTTLLAERWPVIRDGVARVLAGLVEPGTGLVAADSSIWEVHWQGKQKHFAYTSIAASRGLCDAADLARERGEADLAAELEAAGRRVRRAIHDHLTDPSGAVAADTEELATGTGYWDAAAVEAVGLGLFSPDGPTAQATLDGIAAHLTVPAGGGFMRNDDAHDGHDLTPYGSDYDDQEWVFLDYRVAMAARAAGRTALADALLERIRARSAANYLLIAENYDPVTGDYRNNAPMIGFGAGSELTALRQRAEGATADPACGTWFEDEAPPPDGGVDGGPDAGPDGGPPDAGAPDGGVFDAGPSDAGGPDAGSDPAAPGSGDAPASGCGCTAAGGGAGALPLLVLLPVLWRRRRAG